MTERDRLAASIASTISTYRQGECALPTAAHVNRWADQFTPANQIPFLREFDHVIKQGFIAKARFASFLASLVTAHAIIGASAAAYWARANFLTIQRNGHSQREMVALFGEELRRLCGLNVEGCGHPSGDYIYLDDVVFSGGRVISDLESWVRLVAPQKAVVQVILMAVHTGGIFYAQTRLKKAVAESGKKIVINYWWGMQLQNQLAYSYKSDVLWPALVPADLSVVQYVQSERRFPLVLRQVGNHLGPFSSEAGRQLLEQEFLIAGVRIRALTRVPNDYIRPLGNGNFGVGFGSLVFTYRNCPNNVPLAIWWGDAAVNAGALHWYPLLPRRTYANTDA